MTTILLVLLSLFTPAIAVEARTASDGFVVSVMLEPHAENINVQVAVTALDSRPESWAADTVYHNWLLEDSADTPMFDDDWPNMPPGRYRIEATLQRTDGREFDAKPIMIAIVP